VSEAEGPTYTKGLRLCVRWSVDLPTVVRYRERPVADGCREVRLPVDDLEPVDAWVEDSEGVRHPEIHVVIERFVPEPQATYWNGQPTPCRRVTVIVGQPGQPTWWCAGLVGQRRAAVEVRYGAETFFLDNEDGSGWAKVTNGHGSPMYGHRGLPDDSVVVGGTE
jgi:hypothetical protein